MKDIFMFLAVNMPKFGKMIHASYKEDKAARIVLEDGGKKYMVIVTEECI